MFQTFYIEKKWTKKMSETAEEEEGEDPKAILVALLLALLDKNGSQKNYMAMTLVISYEFLIDTIPNLTKLVILFNAMQLIFRIISVITK